MMMNQPFIEKRTHQRFSFFADAEITLHDQTSVRTQVAELSARGCYIGTLVPVPIGTKFRLRISHNMTICEMQGKVIYVHSSNGLGIFGMGILIERISPDERSIIDAWLHHLCCQR